MSDTDLPKMSYEEILKYQRGYKTETHEYKSVERELDRRARVEQHELNLLLMKQSNRFNAAIAVCAAIVGAVVGVLLTIVVQQYQQAHLNPLPKQVPQVIGEKETLGKSRVVPCKFTNKSSASK